MEHAEKQKQKDKAVAQGVRIGLGFDSHRFSHDRKLNLCGVEIPDHPGLAGHSDADCALHAVIDALLGALALPDIGELFPSTDPKWKGVSSRLLLQTVLTLVLERFPDFELINLDVTLITESPRIAPHKEAMIRSLSELLGVPKERISVKGKTNEGMGWIGKKEGMAALCALSART
jgi:2-C-methyl-D-erythritol 2,4-cyclodiphosphate synthase